MNFFKLYIGDYQRDTAHLSVTEHGAYMLMLQHYYATEKPLPTGKALHRMLRAQDKAEREAIDAVAAQFWTVDETGSLVNSRAASEIEKASHQRDVNRELGKRGGRPKRTDRTTEQETESVSESDSDTEPIDNPNQTPDTRLNGIANAIPVDDGPSPADDPRGGADDSGSPGLPDCPHAEVVALYRKHLPQLRQPAQWDGRRATLLRSRWRQCSRPTAFGDGYATAAEGLAFWDRFFGYVAGCKQLRDGIESRQGGEVRVWKPDLPWLLKSENFLKVIEGNYA